MRCQQCKREKDRPRNEIHVDAIFKIVITHSVLKYIPFFHTQKQTGDFHPHPHIQESNSDNAIIYLDLQVFIEFVSRTIESHVIIYIKIRIVMLFIYF